MNAHDLIILAYLGDIIDIICDNNIDVICGGNEGGAHCTFRPLKVSQHLSALGSFQPWLDSFILLRAATDSWGCSPSLDDMVWLFFECYCWWVCTTSGRTYNALLCLSVHVHFCSELLQDASTCFRMAWVSLGAEPAIVPHCLAPPSLWIWSYDFLLYM